MLQSHGSGVFSTGKWLPVAVAVHHGHVGGPTDRGRGRADRLDGRRHLQRGASKDEGEHGREKGSRDNVELPQRDRR